MSRKRGQCHQIISLQCRERLPLTAWWERGGRPAAQLWSQGRPPGAERKAQWEAGSERGREGLGGRVSSTRKVTGVRESRVWESLDIPGTKGPT